MNFRIFVSFFMMTSMVCAGSVFRMGNNICSYTDSRKSALTTLNGQSVYLSRTGINTYKPSQTQAGYVVYVGKLSDDPTGEVLLDVVETGVVNPTDAASAANFYAYNASGTDAVWMNDYNWLNTALSKKTGNLYHKAAAQSADVQKMYSDPELHAKLIEKIGRLKNYSNHLPQFQGLFWTNSQPSNELYAVLLVRYSTKIQYAVSTAFVQESEAKKYGFSKNQRLYPSRPMSAVELLQTYAGTPLISKFVLTLREFLLYPGKDENSSIPEINTADELIKTLGKGGVFSFSSTSWGMYFESGKELAGAEMFTEDDLFTNPAAADRAWWTDRAVKEVSPTSGHMEQPDELWPRWNGRFRYLFPVDAYAFNSNTPPVKNVPDMHTYFGLYSEEFLKTFSDDVVLPQQSAANFSNYMDYARTNMMQKVTDSTIYNGAGAPTAMKMSTDLPPEEGYYFTKDGVQINGKSPLGDRDINPAKCIYFLPEAEKIWTNPTGIAPANWGRWRTRLFAMDLDKINHNGSAAWNANERGSGPAASTLPINDIYREVEGLIRTYSGDISGVQLRYPNRVYLSISGSSSGRYYLGEPGSDYSSPIQNWVGAYDRDLSVRQGEKPLSQRTAEEQKYINLRWPVCQLVPYTITNYTNRTLSNGTVVTDTTYTTAWRGQQVGLLEYACVRTVSAADGVKFWSQNQKFTSILSDVVAKMRTMLESPKHLINNTVPNMSLSWEENCFDYGSTGEKMPCSDYKDSTLFVGNPLDFERKFQKADNIFLYDKYCAVDGHPLRIRTETVKDGINNGHVELNDRTKVFLTLKYPLVHVDANNVKQIVAYINYDRLILEQKHLLANPGWKTHGSFQFEEFDAGTDKWFGPYRQDFPLNQTGITIPSHIFIYDPEEKFVDLMGSYDKETKEYYTDQKDLNERDSDIDKGEAIKDILGKIAVAELINLSMKALHYLAQKEMKTAPIYESAKRIEGGIVQNMFYKIAKETYLAYCLWRTTMDLSADIRDAYKSIGPALDGLKQSAKAVANYYRTHDWKNLKITNISDLIPISKINAVQGYLNHFQYCIDRFDLAVDAMAFHSDKTLDGHYGPLNPVIDVVTAQLVQGMEMVGVEATKTVEENTAILDKITQNSGSGKNTLGGASYISNITALSQTAIQQVNVNVANKTVQAMSMALVATELESESWLRYYDKMTSIPGKLSSQFSDEEARKNPYLVIGNTLYSGGDVFHYKSTYALERLSDATK